MTQPAAQEFGISRRAWLRFAIGASAYALSGVAMAEKSMIRRPIPSSGEALPVIGLGTSETFDVSDTQAERTPVREVLREFTELGGGVIDSSPMYGNAESVVGDLATELVAHKKLFLATKVWTSGREAGIRQMQQSFRRMRTERMDLMQVHNLLDWRTHLPTLRQWREQGKVRYIGITHYTDSAYDDLARVIETEPLDFVQLNYSIIEREAERHLLALAAQRGVAVLVNRPFARAGLFQRVRGKPLPTWARDFDCQSWAQYFLKFVISHPAVTCVIPATSKVKHLIDNMQAGVGRLPDQATRERMTRHLAAL